MQRRSFIFCVILFSLLVPYFVFAQEKGSGTVTIRSSTSLVLVPVQVRNKGQHVPGLSKDKFTLLQDGRPQTVAMFEEVASTRPDEVPAPKVPNRPDELGQVRPRATQIVVVALDTINTPEQEIERVRRALLKFFASFGDDRLAVRLVTVDSRGVRVIQDFTSDPRILAAALVSLHVRGNKFQIEQDSSDLQELANLFGTLIEGEEKDANAERLATALASVQTAQASMERMMAFQQLGTRFDSLQALQQVALSMVGLPGKKTLIWASSGYPFTTMGARNAPGGTSEAVSTNLAPGMTGRNFSAVLDAAALDEYTMSLLNSANIAVYPIDARTTVNAAFETIQPSQKESPTYAEKQAAYEHVEDIAASFQSLASATGGRACVQSADLSKCFEGALADSLDYYLLGFYLDMSATRAGWHKLQVKVSEKGMTVRARTGFVYPQPDPIATRDLDLALALNSSVENSAFPFRLEWGEREPQGEKRKVHFLLKIPSHAGLVSSDKRLDFELAAVARSQGGAVAGSLRQRISRNVTAGEAETVENDGINYTNSVIVPPGEYIVRIVVRDNLTGRIGSSNAKLLIR